MFRTTRPLAWQIAQLAWPVLIAQLASIGMMVADTIIVGRAGTEDLAAVAVGAGIYVSVALALAGVVQALSPVVAHLVGARKVDEIGPMVRQGAWLALLLAVVGALLLYFPGPLLAWAELTPSVEAKARAYMGVLILSLPASLGYRAFSAVANAVGRPKPLMLIAVVETLCHAGLAWLLVGGHLTGTPLGAVGAAISQTVCVWGALAAALGVLLTSPVYWPYRIFRHFEGIHWRRQAELLRLGVPMGISYLVEISAFTLMAVFVARLGAETVAGHRIVANLSALTYMLPLSLATATAALVGQAVGAQDELRARRTAMAGLWLACGLSVAMGGLLWLARDGVVALVSADPAVCAIAAGLVIYIAVYQFCDAAQTIAAFALRGYKVTFVPLLMHITCFWAIGLGGGYWLAFHAPVPQGVAGFWQAAVLATVAASILLGGLLVVVIRGRRVGADSPKRLEPPPAPGPAGGRGRPPGRFG